MRQQRLFTSAAVALAILVTAGPAYAQSGDEEKTSRQRDRSRPTTARQAPDENRSGRDIAVRRGDVRTGPVQNQPAPAANDRRSDPGQTWNNGGSGGRSTNGRSGGGNSGNANRGNGNRGNNDRGNYNRGYNDRGNNDRGNYNRGYDDRWNNNHRYDNRGHDSRYGYGYGSGYGSRYGYGSSYWHGDRYDYGRADRYYRTAPWRSHIRFGLGVSVFAGPAFSFSFGYGWRPSFPYRYGVQPGYAYGGMAFRIDPDMTEVYVDGQFIGVARDFGGQPVPVTAGFHRIELYAAGFEPVGFGVTVLPGQVVPYDGRLYRIY